MRRYRGMDFRTRQDRGVTAAADRDRFLRFYDAAVDPLYRYLHRATVGDRALAEDIAQDVFAAALQQARAGHDEVLTTEWVITVGRNRLVDHWRRVERENRRLSRFRTEDETVSREIGEPQTMLRALPPMQRAAVWLRYIDDLPVEQVAQQLGKGHKATESLLSRARCALRQAGGVDNVG